MPYNKYNTRNTRYNTSGQFVSAGELVLGAAQGTHQPAAPSQTTFQQSQYGNPGQQAPQQPQSAQPPLPPPPPMPAPVQEQLSNEDNDMNSTMETESNVNSDDGNARPHWMKPRLLGVKKISNKERRRRQNESLRRLLSPKNALMVLNEMLPNEQLASQFKVESVSNSNQYFKPHTFVADLNLEGQNYKGFGDNKLTARNSAAEQAIRDLIIKRMTKVLNAEASAGSEGGEEEEPLPMIQLASFALHKLFCEWEVEGHKVPQLRPPGGAPPEAESLPAPRPQKRPKQLPEDAAFMHPCMLLTYMRPSLEYRELATQGDRPQNMLYTVGVDVDGSTYVGKAQNKKEARKAAARAACKDLFGIDFNIPPNPLLQ